MAHLKGEGGCKEGSVHNQFVTLNSTIQHDICNVLSLAAMELKCNLGQITWR
jgi:hypothetical protein